MDTQDGRHRCKLGNRRCREPPTHEVATLLLTGSVARFVPTLAFAGAPPHGRGHAVCAGWALDATATAVCRVVPEVDALGVDTGPTRVGLRVGAGEQQVASWES